MQNSDRMVAVKKTIDIYLLRLLATTRPAKPAPISAIEPGSGTASILPAESPDGLCLQAGKSGYRLQSGLAASREVDTRNISAAIKLFMVMMMSLSSEQGALQFHIDMQVVSRQLY